MPQTHDLNSRGQRLVSKRNIFTGIIVFAWLFMSASLGSAQYCASNQSPQVTGFSLSPSSVVGDSTNLITGTVTLSCAPTSDTNPYLSSSAPNIIPSGYGPDMYGSTSASFGFRAGELAVPTAVTITASLNGGSACATVEVDPLTPKLTLGDTRVIGGSSNPQPTINVTWNAPILNSNQLLLSTSDNGQYVHLPQAVNLGNGQTSITIPAPNSSYFFTTAVPGPGPVSVAITGTLDDGSSSVNLLIDPPQWRSEWVGLRAVLTMRRSSRGAYQPHQRQRVDSTARLFTARARWRSGAHPHLEQRLARHSSRFAHRHVRA